MKKITKITALVLAVILATFTFASCKTTKEEVPEDEAVQEESGKEESGERETKKYSVTFTADEVPGYVADKVLKGAMMRTVESNEDIGLVTDVLVEESVSYASKEGNLVVSNKIGYKSLLVTVTVNAAEDVYGWYIGDTLYGIGLKDFVRIGNLEVELTIRNFEALD